MLETHFDKSISVSGSSNAELWGRNPIPAAGGGIPSRRRPMEFRGRSSRALRWFYRLFSKKIRIFRHILA